MPVQPVPGSSKNGPLSGGIALLMIELQIPLYIAQAWI
jgi:hypothetical protein